MTQTEQNISIRSHVGSDGILHLEVLVEMKNTDIVVTMKVRSLPAVSEVTKLEQLGWSPGFFEETFGTWEGEPLIRASQGEITEWQPFV